MFWTGDTTDRLQHCGTCMYCHCLYELFFLCCMKIVLLWSFLTCVLFSAFWGGDSANVATLINYGMAFKAAANGYFLHWLVCRCFLWIIQFVLWNEISENVVKITPPPPISSNPNPKFHNIQGERLPVREVRTRTFLVFSLEEWL